LCSSDTKRYKNTHKRRGAEYPQATESKTFQSPSDNFDTEIRTDKADAPSTIFETQLIFLFRVSRTVRGASYLGRWEKMDIGQEPPPGNTLTPFLLLDHNGVFGTSA
jgi:hypothetical protein